MLGLFDHTVQEFTGVQNQSFQFQAFRLAFVHHLDRGRWERFLTLNRAQFDAFDTLKDDTRGAVGEFQHLKDLAHTGDICQILACRNLCVQIHLGGQNDVPVGLGSHSIDQCDTGSPVDHNRHDRVRIDHLATQWQKRHDPIAATCSGLCRT